VEVSVAVLGLKERNDGMAPAEAMSDMVMESPSGSVHMLLNE
jgi:hypothetical protein